MNRTGMDGKQDHGPAPYTANVEQAAMQNQDFRVTMWTGRHLQMTAMCIPPCGEIGLEVHENADQIILIEQGKAVVKMGSCERELGFRQSLWKGDAAFVPSGTWHNVVNAGRYPLKLLSVYASPQHPAGTVHRTREDAEWEEGRGSFCCEKERRC